MKPFDLEAALKGAPVVTKRGQKVINIAYLPLAVFYGRVVAVLDGISGNNVLSYDESGHVGSGLYDLFMETKTRTYYVNLWDSPSFHYTKYDSLEAAKQDTRGLAPDRRSSQKHKKLNPEPIEITVEE